VRGVLCGTGELLPQQPLLGDHVVADPDPGELRHGDAALAPPALCGEVDRPLPIWLTATMK
jgi:hypothetical protein